MQNIDIKKIYSPLNEVLKLYSMLPRKEEGVVAHVVSSLDDLKSIWLSIGQTTVSLYILYPMIQLDCPIVIFSLAESHWLSIYQLYLLFQGWQDTQNQTYYAFQWTEQGFLLYKVMSILMQLLAKFFFMHISQNVIQLQPRLFPFNKES